MSSSSSNSGGGGGGGGGGGKRELSAEKTLMNLKEGERIVGPTRRPDGTLRKPIRIRAGYVPQDEVPLYQSKASLWRKEMSSQEVLLPPGADTVDNKPKSKSAKRNEKRKEKRQQQQTVASMDNVNVESNNGVVSAVDDLGSGVEPVKSVTSQLNDLVVSAKPNAANPPLDSTENSNAEGLVPDIDKKIRALKKKIRLAEAQLQKSSLQEMKPEQLEKLKKMEGWYEELKLLEEKKC